MKGKIILFDIDGTLFDSSSFINDFYKNISAKFNLVSDDIATMQKFYEENKKKNGYFLPGIFLDKIAHNFPSLDLGLLNKIFWNIDLFEENMYKDTSLIRDLSKVAVIGIFSKGDSDFQKQKLTFFGDLLDGDNVHVFPNKIDKVSEVLRRYEDFQTYLIDDQNEVLIKAKELFPDTYTILIDRNNSKKKAKNTIKIKSLNDLKSIIYD